MSEVRPGWGKERQNAQRDLPQQTVAQIWPRCMPRGSKDPTQE